MSPAECILFAGPSLAGLDPRLLERVRVEPPIQRGDLPSLVSSNAPGTFAVVDGRFHQCLAVGHAEIRDAMAAGWQVWGLGSMGAIRAAEMRGLGMVGFGQVYLRYAEALDAGEDFHDDEVAQTHEECPPYRSFSEPMVHIRFALESWVNEERLADALAAEVVADLKEMWYGDRSLIALRRALVARHEGACGWLEAETKSFDRFRLKSLDVRHFLHVRPWRAASG